MALPAPGLKPTVFPAPSYTEHPAFRSFAHEAADRQAEDDAHSLDRWRGDALLRPDPDPGEWGGLFTRQLRTLTTALSARHPDPAYSRFLASLSERLSALVRAAFAARGHQNRFRQNGLTGDAQHQLEALRRHGFASVPAGGINLCPPSEALRTAQFEALSRHAQTGAPRVRLDLSADDTLMAWLREQADALSLRATARAYRGMPLHLTDAALELSCPHADWWRAVRYPETGTARPATADLHHDTDVTTVTGLIAIDTPPPESGAFAYIAGSHDWPRAPLSFLAAKALDQLGAHPFLVNPAARPLFMRLPRTLRQVASLGDDLCDGGWEAVDVLEAERIVDFQNTPCVLYDGALGLHRSLPSMGGLRWLLVLRFRMAEHAGISPTRP